MNVKALAVAGLVVALAVASRDALAGQGSEAGADGLGDPIDPDEGVATDDEQTNVIQDMINMTKNTISGNEIAEVIEAGVGYLVVRRPNGTVQKLKGSRNWRNNNPGNIEYGNFTRSMGAIGTDGRFAVFPTYDMGRGAKEKLIFEGGSYKGLNLMDAINRYAPPVENNTSWYQNTVLAAVGGQNKPMGQYDASQRERILNAMERVEGFKPGTVTDVA